MKSEMRITKHVGGDGLKSLPTVGNDGMNRPLCRALSGTLMPVLLSILLIVNMSGVAGAQQAQAATGALRGAVSAAGPDGQAYNIPAASLKCLRAARPRKGLPSWRRWRRAAGVRPRKSGSQRPLVP